MRLITYVLLETSFVLRVTPCTPLKETCVFCYRKCNAIINQLGLSLNIIHAELAKKQGA